MRYVFLILIIAAAILIGRVHAQEAPAAAHARPCLANLSTACNPVPNGYYAQSTASPVPLATATTFYQMSNMGRFTEIVNPGANDTIGHFVYQNGTSSTAGQPGLAMQNLHTNTLLGSAVVATNLCSTSGQVHDAPGLIGGPNGEMLIAWGAISTATCLTANSMSSDGTQIGTIYATQPAKFINPTASPSAVAAQAVGFIPDPAGHSELWSMSWRTNPGDTNTWAGEAQRGLMGGQQQRNALALNGGHLSMRLNQGATSLHWGSTSMTPYFDTIHCTGWNGTACGTNGTSCPSSGKSLTGAALGAMGPCWDPINSTIANATNGVFQLNATIGDNVWRAYALTAVTDSVSGSWTIPALPSNGEPNAGTSCTISGTTAAGETVAQLAQDIVNTFNGSGGTTGTSFSSNCSTWRTSYTMSMSTVGNTSPACTASLPCIVFQVQPSATYSSSLDIQTAAFQNNLPGTATCATFCTASGTLGVGFVHNTVGTCKKLEWFGEEGVCLWDIDHLTFGFFANACGSTPCYAGTNFGDAFVLACIDGANAYSTSAQSWTLKTCNLNGTRTSATVTAGNTITSDNPTTAVSGGIPAGGGAAATCTGSPWLMQNPVSLATGQTAFLCDFSGPNDPSASNNCFGVRSTWDVTNYNGQLLVVFGNGCTSASPGLYACIYDTTTGATDACEQVTTDVLAAAGDAFNVGVETGASGAVYLFVATGSSSARTCGGASCTIEYSAPPPVAGQSASTLPTFSFVKAVSFCGGASAGAPGMTAPDQVGGYHTLDTQLCGTFNSAASSTSLYEYDFITP